MFRLFFSPGDDLGPTGQGVALQARNSTNAFRNGRRFGGRRARVAGVSPVRRIVAVRLNWMSVARRIVREDAAGSSSPVCVCTQMSEPSARR